MKMCKKQLACWVDKCACVWLRKEMETNVLLRYEGERERERDFKPEKVAQKS